MQVDRWFKQVQELESSIANRNHEKSIENMEIIKNFLKMHGKTEEFLENKFALIQMTIDNQLKCDNNDDAFDISSGYILFSLFSKKCVFTISNKIVGEYGQNKYHLIQNILLKQWVHMMWADLQLRF